VKGCAAAIGAGADIARDCGKHFRRDIDAVDCGLSSANRPVLNLCERGDPPLCDSAKL
jgi:hypothetical protein